MGILAASGSDFGVPSLRLPAPARWHSMEIVQAPRVLNREHGDPWLANLGEI